MAHWYYERPSREADATEQWVAERLARLGEDWWIRWGFYYSGEGDPAARNREGDFLLLGPDGRVLVLEVKGGNLTHFPPTGDWQGYPDHPMAQLSAEWKAVLGWFRKEAAGTTIPYVGRALCLPNVPLGSQEDLRARFGADHLVFSQDLEDFPGWWQRHLSRYPTYCRDAEAIFRRAAVSGLEPRSIRDFLRRTDKLFQRHAREQAELLDLVAGNRQFFVEGGAGTGKTFLAVEQACRWAEEGADGQRVLFLVYHLALVEAVEKLVSARPLARGTVEVRGWQEWMEAILAAHGLDPETPEDPDAQADYFRSTLPDLVRECLQSPPEDFRYDALVVDEAQDHDTASEYELEDGGGPGWWSWYFRTLREGLQSRMALFYDGGQRPLFRADGEFSMERLREALPRGVHLHLRRNLRYTRPILEYLHTLRAPGTEKLWRGIVLDRAAPIGPAVTVRTGVTPEETGRVVDELLQSWSETGTCQPDEVLVIGPHRFANTSLAQYASAGDGRVPRVLPWTPREERGRTGNPPAPGPRYLNAYRAKGCESLAVLVIDFPEFATMAAAESEGASSPRPQTEVFFLAASRARQVLAVIHCE